MKILSSCSPLDYTHQDDETNVCDCIIKNRLKLCDNRNGKFFACLRYRLPYILLFLNSFPFRCILRLTEAIPQTSLNYSPNFSSLDLILCHRIAKYSQTQLNFFTATVDWMSFAIWWSWDNKRDDGIFNAQMESRFI